MDSKTELTERIKVGLESAIKSVPDFILNILYPPKKVNNLLELFEATKLSESDAKLITADGLEIVLEKLKPRQESQPGVFSQIGLYLTPPHGRLIWDGKKTAIIKSIKLKSHINKPVYLLSGDYCYGVIRISEPQEISLEKFKELFEKHQISEEERLRWWKDAKVLFFYPVNFIRRWDHPRQWQKQRGAQLFVKNVKFLEESNLSPATMIFLRERQNPEYQEDETREEAIRIERAKYGDWYKVKADPKKTYRYVAQYHIRGNSVHVDLRFEANDHLIGWTLNTPGVPEGSSKPQREYMDTEEDKFQHPRDPSKQKDYQILCEPKLIQPKVWLTVKGEIAAGGIGATKYKPAEFRIISTGRIRFGTQKHDFHEYFLDPDGKWNQENSVKGRWIISYIPRPRHYTRAGEGVKMWAMFKPGDQRPYVEYQDYDEAVEKAKKENGYMLWQDPYKGLLKEVDFREGKKRTWIY